MLTLPELALMIMRIILNNYQIINYEKAKCNKLAFNKVDVIELNQSEMNVVGGGITTTSTMGPMTIMTISCTFCISSSNGNYTQIEY